ncbi:polysaccharide biosynthesis/export family protein [Persicitalea jodogahamensis]|uniref:Polysaccharide biosynthesis protein n=1 Tax=Persicitalea jodogahamensis TaxID=402147 RepID=A0A8J3D8Z1_9BACT|nr:polysaccharide biosynthesis/export family protein [Persicitalea jodogahamensis]GHB62875.1 polysaccharide biosynthesis protein [Persicitalea jodogahamensis]
MNFDRTRKPSFAILLLISVNFLFCSLQSCVSPKSIVYFQSDSLRYSVDSIRQSYTPTIQPNDLLSIVVGSLNPESDVIFNVPNQYTTSAMRYGNTGGGSGQSLGYLVDSDGNIEMPIVGKIRIQDLKTQIAADTIRRRLLTVLREPTVTMRSLNFKVSVLGEVSKPAIYVIPDEKITLPEVLSLAGDLTIYGRRDNVTVIREENGLREFAKVDLTSRDIFSSPYYYLHKNDVVYIEPVEARTTFTDRRLQLLPLFISIVSTVGLIAINLTR